MSSLLRRPLLGVAGRLKVRGSSPNNKGWWSEGTQEKPDGILFGETPPPPGQSRKWESWEAPWYATLVLSVLILGIGLSSKPDTSLTTWARKQAEKELKAEGKL